MKPKDRKERYARRGGTPLTVAAPGDKPLDLKNAYTEEDDSYLENGAQPAQTAAPAQKQVKYSDEQIKMMAIRQAINMAKLFSDITTENIIQLASVAASFIKYRQLQH